MALVQHFVLRGTRAAQPAANTVDAGTLYYVTDESVLERGDGAAWQDVGGLTGKLLTADPGSPANDTWWVRRTGASPAMQVEVRARIAGVTVTLAAITI